MIATAESARSRMTATTESVRSTAARCTAAGSTVAMDWVEAICAAAGLNVVALWRLAVGSSTVARRAAGCCMEVERWAASLRAADGCAVAGAPSEASIRGSSSIVVVRNSATVGDRSPMRR
uniref:Uncharacterized protein n=1 Tax=Arundo donax TaxID=35708 RepID=A0A0A9HXS6_ARUDO